VAEWSRLGDRAIRFARPNVSVRAVVRAVKSWQDVVDVVVTEHHVGVYYATTPAPDPEQLRALAGQPEDTTPVRDHEIRVRYDGPDLGDVARQTGRSIEDICAAHASAVYTVELMGFAPGFAYLVGLDPSLVVPRRATPRMRVPAGSLGIAERYTAVYPFDSPGGWNLIGTTDARMFGPEGPLLALGDRVRFVA
jgi:UPF0271 protein